MPTATFETAIDAQLDELGALYEDLHANPELSFEENRTAGIAAGHLRDSGYEVAEGVGGTGVVGVLHNGEGPTVLLRADMDALPVTEATGLPYASTVRTTDDTGAEVGVAHACGHDMHVTWLLGATRVLARTTDAWSGTILAVVQPAEEIGAGARAMLDDGLYERFGTPDVCLGQHVAPAPAGWVLTRGGTAMAGSDSLEVTMHGRGGHGSTPELTIDPAVMAASTIMKLQTIASREKAAHDPAVVTVGRVRVGTKENVIADHAELGLSIRTYDERMRTKVLDAVERICRGEAQSYGAPDPEIRRSYAFPPLVNDPDATERVTAAFRAAFGDDRTHQAPQALGSEDFSFFGAAAGCPSVFWFTGGHDPDEWMEALRSGRIAEDVPYNHSPLFAPQQHPTIGHGIECLVLATLEFAGPG